MEGVAPCESHERRCIMKVTVRYTWMDDDLDEHTSSETIEVSSSVVEALEEARQLVVDLQADPTTSVFEIQIQ